MTSDDVIEALKAGPLDANAHAWMREVRSATGATGRRVRSADAVVLSCWPSRGIWAAGVEVKVSRSDWRRELANPAKAAEIQRFCHFWWVAAPEGVVEVGEVPEVWGFYEVRTVRGRRQVRCVKRAPRQEPDAWSVQFVASVVRNAATVAVEEHQRGFRAGVESVRERLERVVEVEARATGAERELAYAKRELAAVTARLSDTQRVCDAYREATGVDVTAGGLYGLSGAVELTKLADYLRRVNLAGLATTLSDAAKRCDEAARAIAIEGE